MQSFNSFNFLFFLFYSDESVAKKAAKDGEKKPSALEDAQNSRKRVNLIDAKRAQNAGIALARIKMPFAEVRERYERSRCALINIHTHRHKHKSIFICNTDALSMFISNHVRC